MGYDRFERGPPRRDHGDRHRGGDRDQGREPQRYGARAGQGRPDDYDYDDRDFFHRAGDEVRSWFGDEEAERRRRYDERMDARGGGERDYRGRDEAHGPAGAAYGTGYGDDPRAGERNRERHGDDYRGWRERQLAEYDRDYDEYRRENQSRFDSEFGQWREKRRQQRLAVGTVKEHQEVVGSDGEKVGTVDYIKGDRIILGKSDAEAGGHHHSIPSSWVEEVGDQVRLNRSADQARQAWRDIESRGGASDDEDRGDGPHMLGRSFSGTYDR